MIQISQHSKFRIVQRDDEVNNLKEARKVATIAYRSGKTIDHYHKYPRFFSYLTNKNCQSRTSTIRIYRDNIYIWRGKNRTLVTAHPIPLRYLKEMKRIDTCEEMPWTVVNS